VTEVPVLSQGAGLECPRRCRKITSRHGVQVASAALQATELRREGAVWEACHLGDLQTEADRQAPQLLLVTSALSDQQRPQCSRLLAAAL
jgi:hypothetical protein